MRVFVLSSRLLTKIIIKHYLEVKALYTEYLGAAGAENLDRINRMDRINSTTNPVNPVNPVQTVASFSAAPDSPKILDFISEGN